MDCIFCNGAAQNQRIAQSPRFVAVADRYPLTVGHALVLPRRHVESLFDLDPSEVAEAYDLLRQVHAQLIDRYHPVGFNLGVNDGQAAGAEVEHLCIHLIPRYPGDAADPRGGIRRMLPGPSPGRLGHAEDEGTTPVTTTAWLYLIGYAAPGGALGRLFLTTLQPITSEQHVLQVERGPLAEKGTGTVVLSVSLLSRPSLDGGPASSPDVT